MSNLDPFAARKEAQLVRALAAMPGLQTSVTGSTYRLRCSVGEFHDVILIGRPETAYMTKKGKRIVTHSAVDLTDAEVDQVIAKWRNWQTADGLAFVVRD